MTGFHEVSRRYSRQNDAEAGAKATSTIDYMISALTKAEKLETYNLVPSNLILKIPRSRCVRNVASLVNQVGDRTLGPQSKGIKSPGSDIREET